MDTILRGDMIVSPVGGSSFRLVDPETLELLAVIPLAAGVHVGSDLLAYVGEGSAIELAPDVQHLQPPHRLRVALPTDHGDSAANQDYVPSQSASMARMFEYRLQRLESRIARERAEAAVQERAEASAAPAAETDPVPDPIEE